MRKMLLSILPDVLMIIGAASISFGAWLAYQPAGFVVAGAMAIAAGINIARA